MNTVKNKLYSISVVIFSLTSTSFDLKAHTTAKKQYFVKSKKLYRTVFKYSFFGSALICDYANNKYLVCVFELKWLLLFLRPLASSNYDCLDSGARRFDRSVGCGAGCESAPTGVSEGLLVL